MNHAYRLALAVWCAPLCTACLDGEYEVDPEFEATHASHSVAFLTSAGDPGGVALDSEGWVYFADRSSGTIVRSSLRGGKPEQMANASAPTGYDGSFSRLVLDQGMVYYEVPDGTGGVSLARSSVAEQDEPEVIVPSIVDDAFAVRDGALYWVTGSPESDAEPGLRRLIEGQPATFELSDGPQGFLESSRLELAGYWLYFTYRGALYRAVTTSGATERVLDDVTEVAFFSDTSVFCTTVASGGQNELMYEDLVRGDEIVVRDEYAEVTLPRLSPAGDHLYFVEPRADCASTQILDVSLDAAGVPDGTPTPAVQGYCVNDLVVVSSKEIVFTSSAPEPGVYRAVRN